jgi:hypothetical protein
MTYGFKNFCTTNINLINDVEWIRYLKNIWLGKSLLVCVYSGSEYNYVVFTNIVTITINSDAAVSVSFMYLTENDAYKSYVSKVSLNILSITHSLTPRR